MVASEFANVPVSVWRIAIRPADTGTFANLTGARA